jgi:hypothetical protein
MSPLLTTYANGSAQGYGAFSVVAAAGDFESIATVTVGSGGASSVEFTSIPATYSHLQVRAFPKGNRSIAGENAFMSFNSDTTYTNYRTHTLFGTGASVIAQTDQSVGDNGIYVYSFQGNSGDSTADMFGAGVIDILDYANTNKYKTTRSLAGYATNGTAGLIGLTSGLWLSTSAITSIKFVPTVGTSWLQYSHFALYGIKSA